MLPPTPLPASKSHPQPKVGKQQSAPHSSSTVGQKRNHWSGHKYSHPKLPSKLYLWLFLLVHAIVSPCYLALTPVPNNPRKSNWNMSHQPNDTTAPEQSHSPQTVMVTGANGFLGSYLVQELLSLGHSVHACVRNATHTASVAHLQALSGAADRLHLFSTGDLAQANADTQPFDAPMKSCHAVLHAATPLASPTGDTAQYGKRDILDPTMTSTQELLQCLERHLDTVSCLVLTSSMAAVAPQPEPPIKDESHWSNADQQEARKNWYGATKTRQEQLVREWVQTTRQQKGHETFVYAAICPTVILGPPLRTPSNPQLVDGTMGRLQGWLQGALSKDVLPNDSLSFIHVRDVAKMHVQILTRLQPPQASTNQRQYHDRYMCLVESLHWNDIMDLFKELYPNLPPYTKYTSGPLASPTQFNFDRMRSLGVPIQSTRDLLADSIRYLQEIKALE